MGDFRMPALGADMEKATLVEWLVRPGDPVKRGQIIARVETMKGLIEIEVFEDGVVDRLVVEPNVEAPVGAVLATIRPVREDASRPATGPVAPPVAPPDAPRAAPPSAPPAAAPVAAAIGPLTLRISPSARRLARELGVDVSRLHPTAPDGAIHRADIERAAPTQVGEPALVPPPPPAPRPSPPLAGRDAMRGAIARAMARSKREIPHYYLKTDIDLHAAEAWLAAINAERPLERRILMAAPLLKAIAHALVEVPELNGFWVDDAFRPGPGVHLGVAIALRGGGLIAPAIHDVDRLSLDDLMARLTDLVIRAREGGLRGSELTDGTITVTNLGDRGVDEVLGVIYPPQVALVGLGKVTRRPWAVDGEALAVRPIVTATLSADHRASDGHRGALFLAALDRLLQRPEALS